MAPASLAVPGAPAMDLLNALLDLVDAISAGVAVATFWYAWVMPPPRTALPPVKQTGPAELDRFVRAAALMKPSRRQLT
jgi:hypothetical protein